MDGYLLTQSILIGILVVVTIYYAIQTHRQANFLATQLKAMKKQRRKSIQPSLQVDRLSWLFHKRLETEGTDKEALAPGIELYLSNMGDGPALDLNISATSIVEFVSEVSQVTASRKLHFKLLGYSRDTYLERTSEPVRFQLDLTRIDIPTLEDKDQSIHINFEFRDIDNSRFSEQKSIPMTRDDLRFDIEDFRETDILPCDDNYPTHLLPS